MAVDRQRLAQALAYEEEKRRRLAESIPTPGPVQAAPASRNLRRDLENLSIGIGEGLTNQLEGIRGIVTDPLGAVKGAYETVKGVVRDPRVLADALRYTAQKASSGPLGAGEVIGEIVSPMRGKPVMAEIDVYHGSPHRFDEFDASKIGTGEGAQAFGHGIYFAESPAVAKTYRQVPDFDDFGLGGYAMPEKMRQELVKLSDEADKAKNWETEAGYGAARVYDELLAGDFGDPAKLNQMVEKWYWNQPERLAEARQAIKKATEIENKYRGNLYTADLPDEMVDRMLDWDKPLSEQPKVVQQALAKLDPDSYSPEGMDYSPEEPGQMIYMRIANSPLAKNQAEAAAALKAAGIPGLRYLDAGSRGQGGSGTRNFVVFPGEEKKVKILKRE